MVEVRFTEGFEKELKKATSKPEAKGIVKKLAGTKPTDGDFIALVGDVLLKEKKLKSFRFYFVQSKEQLHYLSKEELKTHLLTFIALSKKNNQQEVIDKLKEDLKRFNL